MAEQMIALSKVREIVEAERAIYDEWAKYGPVEGPKFSPKALYRMLADQCADILAKIDAAAEAPHA